MVDTQRQTAESTQSIRLAIDGMHCASCVSKVERALENVQGVAKANVNLAIGEAAVQLNPTGTDLERLVEAIEKAGFSAQLTDQGHTSSVERRANDEAARWRNRLVTASVILAAMLSLHFGAAESRSLAWINLLLACVMQVYVGWPYLKGAFDRFLHFEANMDTLVALGTSVAFGAGLLEFWLADYSHVGGMRWMDAAMILTFITLGRYLEARTKNRASEALRGLLNLSPPAASVWRDGEIIEMPVGSVQVGDRIVVQAGDKVPLDARVVEGQSSVDQSWLTGEAIPIEKAVGDEILAGTINQQGLLTADVIRQAADTTLAQVVRLVEQTQMSKAQVQRLADRVVAWFVPAVLLIGIATGTVWLVLTGNLTMALSTLVAVLVVACPCAMGLTTPTAILVGSGRAARIGILFRDAATIERTARIDTVVFDKTGTLTEGRPKLTRLASVDGLPEDDWLLLAASAEQRSRHPVAGVIVEEANRRALHLIEPTEHETIRGRGVRAKVAGHDVLVGNEQLLNEHRLDGLRLEPDATKATRVLVAVDGQLVGQLSVDDEIRSDAADLVRQLHQAQIGTVLLSGDREPIVRQVADQLGIRQYVAEVLPADKGAEIEQYQRSGKRVAMAGDGINDAVALAQADVGIALSSGSDIAVESADVVIFRDQIARVSTAIGLAQATIRTIIENLIWAFGYNLLLVPIAAGVLIPFGGPGLPPAAAAAAMAASSVSVVLNSLRLRRRSIRLRPPRPSASR